MSFVSDTGDLFYEESLAKRPLVLNGCLANHDVTSLVKEAAEVGWWCGI